RPGGGNVEALELEHHRAIRVANLGCGRAELDARIGALVGFGVTTFNMHSSPLVVGGGRQSVCGVRPETRDSRGQPAHLAQAAPRAHPDFFRAWHTTGCAVPDHSPKILCRIWG